MSVFLFVYGTGSYYARIGFSGVRPLIYAIYSIDPGSTPPDVLGQTYKVITEHQYEWLRGHLSCDVSFIPADWNDNVSDLECRTHRVVYHLFSDDFPFISDRWDDRQV